MQKGKVFVIMPFEDKFYNTYEILSRKFEKDFEFTHAGDIQNQQNILKDIIQSIYEADIIIADLTNLNPNVFYELGIAHTLNKKVIIITENINTVPFDLKSYRAKEYNHEYSKFEDLIQTLDKYLHGAINNTINFSNPVADFISISPNQNVINTNETNCIEIDSENGFLDFIAEIEDNAQLITDNFTNMSNDLNELCIIFDEASSNIENANKKGYSSGSASYIRKQAKKVAISLNEFSTKLKRYNDDNLNTWNKIEKDSLGLLENNFALREDNKENLLDFVKSLHELKINIIPNIKSTEEFKKVLENSIGIEKTLNQSIRFCNEDFSNYLNLMSQIISSIDRLLNKSKFIVGDVSL